MKKIAALALVGLLTLTGCGSSSSGGGKGHTLTVLAASSLTETFDQLAKIYEKDNPGIKVKLVYDSSATLAQEVDQRAPGGILATADKKTMDQAVSGGGISGTPKEFATNTLVLAVPASNPAKLTSLAGLQRKGVKFLTCVPTAPCGTAAVALLKSNHITAAPASQEVDVKSVLTKLESNNADAGLVYQTDVDSSGGKVKALPIPGAAANPNTYWIAVTKNAYHVKDAQKWVDLLASAKGQAVLTKAGFGKP